MSKYDIIQGNSLKILKTLPSDSVQCVITSPPYWGLRVYGTNPEQWGGDPLCDHDMVEVNPRRRRSSNDSHTPFQLGNMGALHDLPTTLICSKCGAWFGELGLEPTPELYVEHMLMICDEIHRVLKPDGIFWLNIADSYVSGKSRFSSRPQTISKGKHRNEPIDNNRPDIRNHEYLKDKDLAGVPFLLVLALQRRGWWWRQNVIWNKENSMPESVKDRFTRSHEYVFMLTKSATYYFDSDAALVPAKYDGRKDTVMKGSSKYEDATFQPDNNGASFHAGGHERWRWIDGKAYKNCRDVLTIPNRGVKCEHFATFPIDLPMLFIRVSTANEDIVLDPFSGTGTTGLAAIMLGRQYIGIELNPKYAALSRKRISEHGIGALYADL